MSTKDDKIKALENEIAGYKSGKILAIPEKEYSRIDEYESEVDRLGGLIDLKDNEATRLLVTIDLLKDEREKLNAALSEAKKYLFDLYRMYSWKDTAAVLEKIKGL